MPISKFFSNFGLDEEKEYFVENLSLILSAGMGIIEALSALQQEMKSKRMKQLVSEMKADVEAGSQLWQAIQKTELFSDQVISLVRLGESSGQLVENLRVIALQEQKERSFRSKIRSALMYPVFVLGLTLVIGIGIAWFILPKLSTVFIGMKIKLPLITKILIGTGEFLKTNGAIVIPLFFIALAAIFFFLFFFSKTKHIGQVIILHIPGIKKVIKEVELSRFGYIMGTLLDAGLPVLPALQALAKNTLLAPYKKFYESLVQNIEDGNSFQKSFSLHPHTSDFLPIAIQQMIIAGEKSGNLSLILKTISTNYEGRVEISTKNLTVILEPILLVIVWLGVVAVALAVILPIYSLIGGFKTQ